MILQLTAERLARIESLGDNCELGFVLRRLGIEAGSILRWARSEAEQVAALLEQDFADLYEFKALVPSRLSMVEEARFGIHWHTEMISHVVDGRLIFVEGEAARREIHRREIQKLDYLIRKFRSRLAAGGLLIVIKANEGIATATLERLHAALLQAADGASFTLLDVQTARDPALVGTVTERAPGCLVGYVGWLADYNTADAMDFAAWASVLQAALARDIAITPSRHRPRPVCQTDLIMLNLPAVCGPDSVPTPVEDARGGVGVLVHGDVWCRRVEDNYRLHGPAPNAEPSHLRWTEVLPVGRVRFGLRSHCPIPDSVTVQLTVTLSAGGAVLACQSCSVSPTEPIQLELALPVLKASALQVDITASSIRHLASGERAVVDLSMLCLEPLGLVQRPSVAGEVCFVEL